MRKCYHLVVAIILFFARCSGSEPAEHANQHTENTTNKGVGNEISLAKHELKLELEKGKVYTQNADSKTTILQTMGAQQASLSIAVTSKTTFKVLDIQNDGYVMEVRYKKLSMVIGLQQTERLYTTESDEKDLITSALIDIKDKPFTLKITKTGKVSEIKGIETLIESVFDKYKEVDEASRKQAKAQFMQTFGESSLKNNMELCTAVFPNSNVSKGDHWKVQTTIGSAMLSNVESDLVLKEVDDSFYQIAGNSKIVTGNKDAFAEMNGVTMSYDMTGTMTSDLKLERKSGWIKKASFKQSITGNAFVKGSVQMPRETTVPMTLSSETTITGEDE